MDSRELSEWMAYVSFFRGPIDDEWHQAGLIATASLAPHCRRGETPKPSDFIPVKKPRQHSTQITETLENLAKALGQNG